MARLRTNVLLIGTALAMISCGDGASNNLSKRARPSQAFLDYVDQFASHGSCDEGKKPGCAQLEIISSAYRGSQVLKGLQVACDFEKQESKFSISNNFNGTETLRLTFFYQNGRSGTHKCAGPEDTSCRLEGFIQEKTLVTNKEQRCYLNIYTTRTPIEGDLSCENFTTSDEKISIIGESRFTCPM